MPGSIREPSPGVWQIRASTGRDRLTGRFNCDTRTFNCNKRGAIRDKAGRGHLTFHSLRHFSATALAGQGVGIRIIADRLGHANPSLTVKTYALFLDVADREAAIAIGNTTSSLMSSNGND